ncbi:MAG: hypothetical protein CM1200mP29_03730 [Verrucomicrobiota bacterium]|nr:MAG: hypothetical protein CM1200mP29_03730 [Verrucomicrobiota bacterium]
MGQSISRPPQAESLEVISEAKLEPALAKAGPGERFQFERLGYFCADPTIQKPGKPVFNRTVTLRDPGAGSRERGEPPGFWAQSGLPFVRE